MNECKQRRETSKSGQEGVNRRGKGGSHTVYCLNFCLFIH